MKAFSLQEYERLEYSRLPRGALDEIESISLQAGAPLFKFHRRHLQAQQYVGVVQTGSVQIEVLPKIHASQDANLVYLTALLSFVGSIPVKHTGLGMLRESHGTFLEVWIRYYAEEAARLLRQHPLRGYLEVDDDLRFLRGRLRVEHLRAGTEHLTARYPCRHEVFTADIPINRVIRFCCSLLSRTTRVPSTRQLLRGTTELLAEVSNAPASIYDLDRIHLNRLNRRYEPLLELSRLLLSSGTLDLRAGRFSQILLVFDMNRLFEAVVAHLLERNYRQLSLGDGVPLKRPTSQKYLGRLFGKLPMNVDVALENEAGRRVLLDTKYKILEDEGASRGPSRSDLYQMFGYVRGGRLTYDDVILLYPEAARERTLTGGEAALHVRSIRPARMVDLNSGRVDHAYAVRALGKALSVAEPAVSG